MSERVYRQWIVDLAAGAQRPKHELRDEIVAHVHNADAAGESWAAEVLARWENAGASRDYSVAHKSLNSVTYIRRDGRRARKTTSYSRPKRSPESGEIVGYQMQAWWGMDRAQVADLYRDLDTQMGHLGDSRAQVRAIAAAMDRHPECTLASEAWLADGHSLDEIDLSDVAS